MREVMSWTPFRNRFFMSSKLTREQSDRLLDRMNEITYDRGAESSTTRESDAS
jgi:hypothetical protein